MSNVLIQFQCSYCKQNRRKSGVFRIFKEEMKYFCSNRCLKNEVKRLKKRICINCGKPYNNYNSIKDRKYCSKKCGRLAQSDWYEKYNWCDLCNKWIPKAESLSLSSGFKFKIRLKRKKEGHCFCPRCNNELRTTRKYK